MKGVNNSQNSKWNTVLLTLLITAVFFSLALNTCGQGWDTEKSALANIGSWTWYIASGKGLLDLGKGFLGLVHIAVKQIYAFITFLLEPVVEGLLWLVGWSLRLNPTIYPFDKGNPAVSNLTKTILKLLIPFYGILLLLIAIYIVYVSISPSDRALAKSQFNKVLMSMFLVSISPPLFQLLLDIELDMVKTIWNIVEDDWSDKVVNGVVVAFLGPQAVILGWLPIIISVIGLAILAFRYLVVQLLAIFFPLSFFLFFFDYTRTLGANLLRTTILWIFMPVAQVLVLAITVIALTGGGVPDHFLAHGLVVLAGMTAFAVSGLMVTGMLKWVGGITAAMGAARGGTFSGAMLQSVGQIGMGFGPDSIVAGAAQVGYLRAGQTTPGMSGIWGRMWGGVKETMKPYGEIGRGVSRGYGRGGILGAVGGFFTGSGRAYGSGMARTGGNIARGARESYHGYKTGTRVPKHPDKASGGGAGGTGGGGVEGSDVTATTSVPEAPDFRSGGGMGGNVPDEWRYGKGGPTGMKTLHGQDLSYPTRWWSEHIAPMLVDSDAVMRAVDRGTSQGLRGMSLLHYAMELAKTPGASKMAIAGAFIRGVKGVGFALMPISPFEPIRQIGAFIVGTSAQLLPPGARWVGYQVGNRMMGMGFRQVHGRSRAGRKLWGIMGRGGIAKKASSASRTLAEIEDLEKERLTATGGRLAEIDARLIKLTKFDGTTANDARRNDVKAHYRAKRDRHVRAISGTLDALREGTDVLNERDPNYVQACLTSLENNYSSKDERQDIFKLVLADSQSLSEGKGYEAHPGTELVRDLESRVGDKRQEIADASLGARTFDQVSEKEAWSKIFSEEIVDLNDDNFKKEVSRRKRAGTLSSEAANEWGEKRESLLTHFRAHRIGHRNPETVPMKERESAQASMSKKDDDEGKLYRAKPLDNAVAFAEMGDYASRAFTARGLAGYVQLTPEEMAAATPMERILDPQTGAMSLTMDLERTESGAMLLNQEDYSYLRQRMAYEGGQVERVRIEPILQGYYDKEEKVTNTQMVNKLRGEEEALRASGTPADIAAADVKRDKRHAIVEKQENWATDSEGKVMVRNVATLPESFESSGTLLDRNTTYGTFQSELLHAAEDPLYQSIGKHGGRNAQISFTDGVKKSRSFDRDELVQERDASGNLVYGFRVEKKQVGETVSEFREGAKQRRKAGRHSEAVDLDYRADRIREGRGFIALSDLAGHYDEKAASGAGKYNYEGQYTPTTAGVVHIESPAHARKFVENNSTYFGGTSDTVHLRGAGVLTENYTMGDTVEVWDPTTQSRITKTVDDAFLTERGKQLEAMKKLGVYIDSDEADALVQKELPGSRVNDFLMRYAAHAASLPEAMRPKAIKFDYDWRDANPYAIEKTTGTLVLNAGSKMLQADIFNGDTPTGESVIPALGHEGGHLLVSWAASGAGSREQVTTAEDMYEKIIISGERLDETVISGGNAAVARGRTQIRRSGFNPTDAGMAVDETLASAVELGRHSQNQARASPADLPAAQEEELAYIRTQTKALQEATNIYAERAINPKGSISDNDTANMAQAAAIAEELERRAQGLDAALGTTDSAAVRASVEALTGTASAPDKMTIDEAFRAAGHDFSAPSMGGETRRVFELFTGLQNMVSTPVAPGSRVT
ncbi:MAG: hypothetical protein ABH851_06465 [Methanobacteriota archaeon]